jgi:hypothetical protein
MTCNNSDAESTESRVPEWTPFRPCPDCGCEDIRVLVITENIVQGDGDGGITKQEWVTEYDILTAECNACETELHRITKEDAVDGGVFSSLVGEA